jgi:hypothetical protein
MNESLKKKQVENWGENGETAEITKEKNAEMA